jgi:putative nucleotidyltransferase with HDIG domain
MLAVRLFLQDRIATGAFDLPLLPQIAHQVLTLAGNPQSDALQLSALIHRDPALAGHVLRIANSPAYMPKMPIVSLQQAVARLGLAVVTEITFAASVSTGVFKVPGYEGELKQLWRHSLASGAFAKEVARVRRSNVESAFLCGLLHAVGKPALLQVAADAGKSLRLPLDRPALPALLEELHTPVGCRIAEKWGLPRQVTAAITHYSDYSRAAGFVNDAMITCLADRLATHALTPQLLDAETLRQHPVIGDLNLYPDDVNALCAKTQLVLEVVDAMAV